MTQAQLDRLKNRIEIGQTLDSDVQALLSAFLELHAAADEALEDYDNDSRLTEAMYDTEGLPRLNTKD